MITLDQVSSLTNRIKQEEWVQVQFETEDLWSVVHKASQNQYSYMWALVMNGKALKLREILINLGAKPKQ